MPDAPIGATRRPSLHPDSATGSARHARALADPASARRALERVRRMAPEDPMVALDLALACLRGGDPAAALPLLAEVCTRHDVADAWLGLAASALHTNDLTRATAAMHAALSRHVAGPTARRLAAAIAAATGSPGWCAVDGAGRLHASAAADLLLDGQPLRPAWRAGAARIPPGRRLEAAIAGRPLLGSPVDLAAIAATEGFVAAEAGGLAGWAWHPGDPTRDPTITVASATTTRRYTLTRLRESVAGMRPLARPRAFTIPAADLPPGMLSVTGPDGRHLLGSPVDPGLEQRSAASPNPAWSPVWADVVGPPPGLAPVDRPIDVVVPVYGGGAQTLACLHSVLASLPAESRLHVVDDASPDEALAAALQALARDGRILLQRQPQNRGYPAAANAGMAATAGRDVVLLNSDTLVPPGWLQALAAALRSAPDIGTACPLSNNATILSYPGPAGSNPMPDAAGTAASARLAQRANGAATANIPVAHGFCMLIRRECLDQAGPFREDLFAQGYGEENDFCLRARHRGWRHVAALGAFVAHQGGASFGTAQSHLQARNAAVLTRLHPGYDDLVANWIAQDPLAPARLRMDALRWRAGRRPRSAVLVTHAGGGGVDRVVEARATALHAAGLRAIVLRPDEGGITVHDPAAGPTPNLRYPMPAALPALARLLAADRPTHVEIHHMLGHDPALFGLAARLGVPHEVHIHDYAWFCPRIALVPERSYCGEPPVSGCEACVADHGSNTGEDISVAALVARSAGVLRAASRVLAPAADVASRLRRHFPLVQADITPWEEDAAIPPPPPPRAVRRVCLVGGIGTEKGYGVLLACLRDAAARRLPLRFALVGHSQDDSRLLDAGPIDITGRYAPAEAESLIRAQAADIAFLPSIWPETWCFTLGHAWRAGLRAAVFDLGTPAERVRRTGWGWVLPLNLPPPAINDWFLRLNPATQRALPPREHFPPQSAAKLVPQDASL